MGPGNLRCESLRIHMNGRIYDSAINRFLQADPIVQAPTFVLNYNRYSYVINNPINAVDPSGYAWYSSWDDFTDAVSDWWNGGSGNQGSADNNVSGSDNHTLNDDPQQSPVAQESLKDILDIKPKKKEGLGSFMLGMGRGFLKDALVNAHSYITGLTPEEIGDPMGLTPDEGGAQGAGAEAYEENALAINLAMGLLPGRQKQVADELSDKVKDVIDETLSSTKKNLTSEHTLTADEALDAGIEFLGDGYKEIGKPGSGVFRSLDGTRQFRMDDGSLSGSHAPNTPHVHFEVYESNANKPSVNNHVPFVD